jgi:hypothetical protein
LSCNDWISAIIGFGALLISLLALWKSNETSRKQEELTIKSLKVELYSKRYDVYIGLKTIIKNIVLRRTEQTTNSAYELGVIKDEVVFLFDEGIHNYLKEVINNYSAMNNYTSNDPEYCKLWNWFDEQYSKKGLRNKFRRYLELSNYGLY